MALEKLKSVFGPSDLEKFQNLQKSIHDDDKQHHHDHSFLDPPPNGVPTPAVSRMDKKPEPSPSPIPHWMGDTSDYNIDGTPSFETISLSDIYLKFSSNLDDAQTDTRRSDIGGDFNLNFNNLFKAATGNPQNLSDIISLGNTKIMTSGEFGDASLYYIDSAFGDVMAVDATINKFGRMGEKFNKVADKIGLPGINIPNIDIFGQVQDVLGLSGDLIYQNQVFELYNTNAPTDGDAVTLNSSGDFFGVPEFENPTRGVAFQALGAKNKKGDTDFSYQGQVVNRSQLGIGNPIAGWRSGDIKFKDIQLPKIDVDLPGLSGFDVKLPRVDLPPLPNIDLPNLGLGGLFDFGNPFPKFSMPKFSLGNFDFPNLDLGNLSLPNLGLAGIGSLLKSVNTHIKGLWDGINFPDPDFKFPDISGWGGKIKIPSIPFPKIKIPDIDFSGVGKALQNTGDFLSGVAKNVGSALGDVAEALGNAAKPVTDYLSKIKVSPFKVNGNVDWGDMGFNFDAGNLNPIDSVRLPSLKLQNPFNVNKTDFGGVGKLVENQPRSDKLLDSVTRKMTPPSLSKTSTYTENATIGTPYSQLGASKYSNNTNNYYPTMIDSRTGKGDFHTISEMAPNLKHLNNAYALAGDATKNKIEEEEYGMPFYFYDLRDETYITFRAYIEALTEQLSPSWSPQNYVGRSEPVYVYERTERNIDFTLKLYAGNGKELDAIYSKMRRLTSLCYPEYKMDVQMSKVHISPNTAGMTNYSGGKTRMKPPLTRLRIGELYGRATTPDEAKVLPSKNDVLGFVKSLSYSIPESSTWEYQKGQRVPKHIVATISYQVIHDSPPHKGTGFYGYAGSNVV